MLVVGRIGLLAALHGRGLDVGAADGASVDFTTAGASTQQATINTMDLLGNPYGIGLVGSDQVMVSAATKMALSAVSIDRGSY
jgi:hypothetical protein